ncbi:hypothetical protein FHS26_001361 [Rhizobium pisi]|uniref:DUF429 domain-containing protein n=1 Tax=Rhizobium pisi TaxID=574561 RepID=A0A7W5BKJ9_9HYPH|nr:hypothetical protein [Rhizobium pisi]MBB3133648.1 hypothetical protein [Rhizobium pisi]
MSVAVIAHCDWSIDRKKRWMCVAVRQATKWILSAPEPVGETNDLIPRLRSCAETDAALLMGFDFPIGLPAAYGKALGLANFRSALRAFGGERFARWFDVAEHRNDIAIDRPFYPMRPGGTQRRHLFDALGVGSGRELLRRCERATADRGDACMLFWTLGGNQVGKAAISGWREIIIPNVSELVLWPFDGSLADLTKPGATVVLKRIQEMSTVNLAFRGAPCGASDSRLAAVLLEAISSDGWPTAPTSAARRWRRRSLMGLA